MHGENSLIRITTERLFLRPVQLSDAAAIKEGASNFAIADTMISIPHPYPDEDYAEDFIRAKQEAGVQGKGVTFVMIERASDKDLSYHDQQQQQQKQTASSSMSTSDGERLDDRSNDVPPSSPPFSSFVGVAEIRDIEVDEHSCQAEVSFWVTADRWGKGYMSEAVRSVVKYGFTTLNLNRLYAYHMVRNPASGRVLEKNRFTKEGVLRQRVKKWNKYEDVAIWSILACDVM